jgi:tRNA U34 5-methylaminomethyl-2-thiouridine-forming methyltransferase MnmC
MKRSLILTAEGSHTVLCDETGETYHSMHGSMQETEHVFIRNGLLRAAEDFGQLHILEMGFGTGLNALLTLQFLKKNLIPVHYTAVEAYPLTSAMAEMLNYFEFVTEDLKPAFKKMHECACGERQVVDGMEFLKRCSDIRDELPEKGVFNLVYFDAFSADKQPELWSESVFSNIFHSMADGGILVTYSAKGSVRRAMRAAGFTVERLRGAKGKREMFRAVKKAR